jgi:uncharacterized protein (TIGR03083 family)
MPDKITFITQEDLLARIQSDRSAFAALWQNLTDERMLQRPGPQDDWSVKDLIAHIVWWENSMLSRVEKALGGEVVELTGTIDEINEHVFQENKDRDLSDVISEFDANMPKLEDFVAQLSDEQINNPDVINIKGHALRDFIIGDTFGHYEMHREDLQNFVQSLSNK